MSTTGITSSLLGQITDSTSTENQFVTNLNQMSSDLQSGNLSAAQEDYVTLSADALNGATAKNAAGSASSSASGTTPTPPVDSQKLIQAIVEAIAAGDDSAVSSDMAALASIAPSSAGATVLQQESANYGSSAGSSSATSSISQLL